MSPKECKTKDKCRLSDISPPFKTLAFYKPVYDGNGKNLNQDKNIRSGTIHCETCGKSWKYYTSQGKTEYHEIKESN